jgi:hypothetical protein
LIITVQDKEIKNGAERIGDMASGPYERFYPGEDKGLLDPTWGGGPYRLNAPSISQVEPWHVGAALGVSAVPGLIGLGEAAVPSLLRGAQLVNRGLTTAGSKVDDVIKTATGPLQSPSRRKALKDIAVAMGKAAIETGPVWLPDLSVPTPSAPSFPAINTLKASIVPMLKKTLQSAAEDERDIHYSEDGAIDLRSPIEGQRKTLEDSHKIAKNWNEAYGKPVSPGLGQYNKEIYFDDTDEQISQKELRTLERLWNELRDMEAIPGSFVNYEEGNHPPLLGLPESERAGKGPLGGKELRELFLRVSEEMEYDFTTKDAQGRTKHGEGIRRELEAQREKYPDYVGRTMLGRGSYEIYGPLQKANDVAIALEWYGRRNPKLLLEAIDSTLKSGDLAWGFPRPTWAPAERFPPMRTGHFPSKVLRDTPEQDETAVYFLERLRNEIVRENRDKLTDFIDAGLISADWYLGK